MKTTTLLITLFAAVCAFVPAAEPVKTAEEIPLRYVEAAMAYDKLRGAAPDAIDAVESIQIERNTIVLKTGHPKIDAVRTFLSSVDLKPKQIVLRFTVSEIDALGKERVISRPTLHTLDGEEAEISWGEQNGKTMKIKVTASGVAAVAE